jgi:predicted transcriptional regulator
VNDKNELIGLITQRQITTLLASFKMTLDSAISKAVQKEFKKLQITDSLKYLSRAFQRYPYVLVEGEGKFFVCENKHLLQHILKNSS